MNHIENTRSEIKRHFNPDLIVPDSKKSELSPSKNFRLDTVVYKQDKVDLNWEVTKVELYDLRLNQVIFDFFVNDSSFFHDWIDKDDIEFFICAEDIFGGQTIIDLTNKKMSSYSSGMDGFIWTHFFLSPDRKILATIGCYWACPNTIKLFDFSNPMHLPLTEIKEFEISNNEIIKGWLDNKTLLVCNCRYETVQERAEDRTYRYKTVLIKTEPVREITID